MAAVEDKYRRSAKDIDKVITLAKLDRTELTEITQVLQFAPDSSEISDIKFLELDSHLLKTIKDGDCLTFRGSEDESVVLCSKNKTYDLQEAQTSNSLLLIPDLKFSKDTWAGIEEERILLETAVTGVFYKYFEIAECKPKFSKLLKILEPSAFNGKEYESLVAKETLYDWERLTAEIQASEDELREALPTYVIANLHGYYRSVTFEYEAKSLTMMLDLVDENSWDQDEVDKEISKSLLVDFIPDAIFEVLFHAYAEPSEKIKENGDPLFRYNEVKVCQLLAKVLLALSPVNQYDGFMDAWNIGTPTYITPKEAWLSGIALVIFNTKKNTKEVIAYPATDLPRDINERFNELFKTKEKWTIEEITPYIADLASNKCNVNGLLTKHARSSTENGIKYYGSKHSK